MFKKPSIDRQVSCEIYEAERMLLEAEGVVENAIAQRDKLRTRLARLKNHPSLTEVSDVNNTDTVGTR